MPELDHDLYADLYGEEEDDDEKTGQPRPSGSQESAHSKVPTSLNASTQVNAAPLPKPPPSSYDKHSTSSYASQVAQQFSAYRKQQVPQLTDTPTSPIETAADPVSPLTSAPPSYAAQTAATSAIPTSVRPSEMKDEGKMFIGGLNWETTDESLRDYMSQWGPVDACTIMRDPTGRSRGFAFLTYVEGPSVDACLALGEHVLDGKVIDPKRAVPRQEYLKHQRVFVGGLAPSVTSASLKEHFQQYGDVVDCMVMLDRETNRSKGFGFVTYSDVTGMEKVLNAGEVELDGKVIEVKEATPRGAQNRANGRNQQESPDIQQSIAPAGGSAWPGATNGMSGFNPAQMTQLYARMMQMGNPMMGMGMGMNMGMMNPMMMSGMNGMNPGMMGMMNPMNPMGSMGGGMGYGGMNNMLGAGARAGSPASGQGSGRGGRGAGYGGGPSRMVNRGANNFHPYAR